MSVAKIVEFYIEDSGDKNMKNKVNFAYTDGLTSPRKMSKRATSCSDFKEKSLHISK
ncbi:Hypothetical predicted protein [Olea europaea subsp. europaea]|uniref:Uncharacterized protein n=1 Tax=Olea europaea subsp. europaea TaxID=158383 RepID=A0A8S0QVW1_OLEEU|nr:Hypothetical predicted protein [Olea europaea subsp. europaea]